MLLIHARWDAPFQQSESSSVMLNFEILVQIHEGMLDCNSVFVHLAHWCNMM